MQGGTGSDSFIVNRSGSGLAEIAIDGGNEPATGTSTDVLDLTAQTSAVSVALDASYDGDFYVTRLESIDGANGFNNTLVGSAGNNAWNIDGAMCR